MRAAGPAADTRRVAGPAPLPRRGYDRGPTVSVADTILAVVRSIHGPVCCRADVEAHPAWGWAGLQAASIPHPARRLEREGLLSRRRGRWRVLPAGEARADEAIRRIDLRRNAMVRAQRRLGGAGR